MKRISIIFRYLGCVGFAFLLVMAGLCEAEWYTDSRSPDFHWDAASRPTIVSDGLGGAFFAFCTFSGNWPHVGHINADGEFTFPQGNAPFEFMLPVDSPQYAGTPLGVTLVPSKPLGTVIAIAERVTGGLYGGIVFSKFDTLGLTSFGTVGSADIGYRMDTVPLRNDSGWTFAASDGAGGVHYVIRTQGTGGRYYNRLDSSGTFTHGWPGLSIGSTYRTLYSDGFDGVFLLGQDGSREDSITLLRFTPLGEPLWGIEGIALVPDGDDIWLGFAKPIYAGKLVFWRVIESAPDSFDHIAYAIDTTGSHVWPQDGVLLECGGPEGVLIEPNRLGGFFYNHLLEPGIGRSCHHDQDGNIVAIGAEGTWIRYPDESGGGYDMEFEGTDSCYMSWYRRDSFLNPVWQDQTEVINVPGWCWGLAATPDGFGGLIGIVSTGFGNAIFHLNPDGSMGDYLEVSRPRPNPTSVNLLRTFPNPFNSTLSISLAIPAHQETTVALYDLLGREVDVIYRGRLTNSTISYRAATGLASGIYFVRAEAGGKAEMRKVVLLK